MIRGKPMQSLCGAHCRTTGQSCRNYSMPNGRCRMHGGSSTGRPATNGYYTKDAIQERHQLNLRVRALALILRGGAT